MSIEAQTYVFQTLSELERDLWSFDDFVKKNAWKWYGEAANEREDIVQADMVRERLSAMQNTVSSVADE